MNNISEHKKYIKGLLSNIKSILSTSSDDVKNVKNDLKSATSKCKIVYDYLESKMFDDENKYSEIITLATEIDNDVFKIDNKISELQNKWPTKEKEKEFGQYFTVNTELKEKVYEYILNSPSNILEPSIGQGDLIVYIKDKMPRVKFDMYEIDMSIKMLNGIEKDKVVYGDFMEQKITKKYKTIVGNPPYVRTKSGNLYIDFTEKCYNLLDLGGELIFIVPSNFFKLTSASKLMNIMMDNGTFTHIYHPNNIRMFKNASVDVIVFRYCKSNLIEKEVIYNNELLNIINSNGMLTFEKENRNDVMFNEYFDIYTGLSSGKEGVFKNKDLGNIKVINGEGKNNKYIYIKKFPCENNDINSYLFNHKRELIERKSRKFNEKNWFEWSSPRNITKMENNTGEECIYIHSFTRKSNISFIGKVEYFAGSLLMLKPKKKCDLNNIVSYLNSIEFKKNFLYAGMFKIQQRQLCNSFIPSEYL